MNFRKLGNSDLRVSEIALGSWLTYSGGIERKQAEACVHRALDEGINFFDTANVYGRGASEEFLGQTLKGLPRDSYILATKLYFPMNDDDSGLSREQIFKQIDASLKRLKVTHIDLYQCHRFDEDVPLEETMHALSEVVHTGKARYIGFSEWTASQISAALQVPGTKRFVSSQPQYSMIWRKPEPEVIPLCRKESISQIVWSPLGQGLLTGKYQPGKPPPSDSRAANPKMNGFLDDDRRNKKLLEAIQRLAPIAKDAGLTLPQLALAWVLREPNVAAAIIGATKPEQIVDNVQASGKTLSKETLDRIDDALEPVLK